MIILDRYMFRGFIGTFLFSVLLLWILYIVGDIFGFLDEILKEGITVSSLAASVSFNDLTSGLIITSINI